MATFKPTQTAYPEKVENKVAAWLNVIPSTSILMMGILLMMKPDDFFEFISTSANYFGVSDRIMMMGLGAFGVAVMAIAQCGLWIKDYFVEREKQRKEGIEIAQKEREALITFFESTNGKKCWKDKTRWCSSEPLKKWKGVHLDPETGRVRKIILPDNNLTGDLPGPLFLDLAYLKELDLRQNQISGPIPEELAALERMEGLYLYDNFLTGPIPQSLKELPNLQGIYLFSNKLVDVEKSREAFKDALPEGCQVFI